MRKAFTSFMLLSYCMAVHGQVLTRNITVSDLPNLIPGYWEISTINAKSVTCNPAAPPADPGPADGDATTEREDVYDYADPLAMVAQMSNGNITITSKGEVWTILLNTNNIKNIDIQLNQFNLFDSALMFIYNDTKFSLPDLHKGLK